MHVEKIAREGKRDLLLLILVIGYMGVLAQDSLKNLPELSLPLTDRKMVIAHCMTNIMRYKGHLFEDACNPDYYSPKGNITSTIGGLTQVLPVEDRLLKDQPLDSAVAFCISHPSGGTEQTRIADYSRRINGILDSVGRDDPHWLRTPDGRLILYLWYGDGLADLPAGGKGDVVPAAVARAYRKLGDAVHERFACVFTINGPITDEKLDSYLDYFPACWIWTLPYTDDYIGKRVAAACKKRGRTFTGSTFCDFYTSKVLARGTWNILDAQAAVQAGISGSERKYIVTGLSYNFRKLLQFGIVHDGPLMNITTWRDYPEGHHLAPEINHNDGFSILLNYYKSIWKGETSPYRGKDIVVVFFKKYGRHVIPQPYNFPLIAIEKGIDPVSEDSIEVITLLDRPSQLVVNGRSMRVPAGFADSKFPLGEGQVHVAVYRDQAAVINFITPEGITLHPFRTDRLTYAYSNYDLYRPVYTNIDPVPSDGPSMVDQKQ